MGAVQVTWSQEVHTFRKAYSCAIPITAFLAVCGWAFVSGLRIAEGSVLQLQTIWGVSVAPWLPVLCAVLTMRLFAEERATGMIQLLLAAPVRERDFVMGKFLAAMTVVAVTLLLAMLVPKMVLPFFAPRLGEAFRFFPFFLTFLGLLLQASTWCAAGIMVSVFSKSQAAAAVISLVLCCGLPTALYLAVLFWFPEFRARTVSYPFLNHIYNFSTGLFSSATISYYLFSTVFFLFACSKRLACLRLKG